MDHQAFAQLLANYGEFVGAIAVVITLVYLAIQIKQSSKIQKAQTHQQIAHFRGQSIAAFIENKELRDAVAKAWSGQSLTEDESAILYWFTIGSLRAYENDLYRHSQGVIDDREVEIMGKLLELPHMRLQAVLARGVQTFSPELQEELRSLIEKRESQGHTMSSPA